MEKVINVGDLKNPTPEMLRKMTEEFSFMDFYKLKNNKAGIVVTPEQVIAMISPQTMEHDYNYMFHSFHRSIFKSINEMISNSHLTEGKSFSSLNISCFSTSYINFCFIEANRSSKLMVSPKMLEVVDKIKQIILAHPKTIQYGDMRESEQITINEYNSNKELIIGMPIDDFIARLDREFAEIRSFPRNQNKSNDESQASSISSNYKSEGWEYE